MFFMASHQRSSARESAAFVRLHAVISSTGQDIGHSLPSHRHAQLCKRKNRHLAWQK